MHGVKRETATMVLVENEENICVGHNLMYQM
jgi:hypothetical protein